MKYCLGNIYGVTASLCIMGLLVGCAAIDPDPTRVGAYRLTQQECNSLIRIARYNLTRSDRYVTARERHIITNREPEFNIAYSAPRTGKATIRWELGRGRVIRVTAFGPFLTSRMAWRVNIENFSEVEHNKTRLAGKPLGKEDFADLLPAARTEKTKSSGR